MKKLFAVVLALAMAASLFACGGLESLKDITDAKTSDSSITGTWTSDSIEMDGSKFSIAELEAMDDDSLSGLQIVIKDGGKAYVSYSSSTGEITDWEQTGTDIKIGIREGKLIDDMICLEFKNGNIYFKKASDSQEITNTENNSDSSRTETEDIDIESIVTDDSTENEAEDIGTDDTAVIFTDCSAIEDEIETDVENTLSALEANWDALSLSITDYQSYIDNLEKIESFYEEIYNTSQELCIRMCEYSIKYAEAVLASGESWDDMYSEIDGIYEIIYDYMGDEIYNGIYDGVLDDMYDALYSGVLDDEPDGVNYSDWCDICSNEYEMWSDTSSDVYDHWSDCSSDVYNFWSDISGKILNENLERAKKEIEDFREDVDKIKSKAGIL